ncbi:MAG: peptide-methionine (R)-S-oxide reductase MsrB, partial [Bryobacteraceae bacterium]
EDFRPRLFFVDESSLASGKQMRDFLQTLQHDDRVLLVGDTRQHQSVEAGRIFAELQDAGNSVIRFDSSGKEEGRVMVEKLVLSDAEWKKRLSPQEFEVTRKAGTELAFTGRYWNNHDKGLYRCVCCQNALFSSDTKFESGTAGRAFWAPVAKENIETLADNTFGPRTEVKCHRCEAHLGHVFGDGPPPTGLRYCMNGTSLKFEKV